jgi:hypothetical protein
MTASNPLGSASKFSRCVTDALSFTRPEDAVDGARKVIANAAHEFDLEAGLRAPPGGGA